MSFFFLKRLNQPSSTPATFLAVFSHLDTKMDALQHSTFNSYITVNIKIKFWGLITISCKNIVSLPKHLTVKPIQTLRQAYLCTLYVCYVVDCSLYRTSKKSFREYLYILLHIRCLNQSPYSYTQFYCIHLRLKLKYIHIYIWLISELPA